MSRAVRRLASLLLPGCRVIQGDLNFRTVRGSSHHRSYHNGDAVFNETLLLGNRHFFTTRSSRDVIPTAMQHRCLPMALISLLPTNSC